MTPLTEEELQKLEAVYAAENWKWAAGEAELYDLANAVPALVAEVRALRAGRDAAVEAERERIALLLEGEAVKRLLTNPSMYHVIDGLARLVRGQ